MIQTVAITSSGHLRSATNCFRLRSYPSKESSIPLNHQWTLSEVADATTAYLVSPAKVEQDHPFVDASTSGSVNPSYVAYREVQKISSWGEDEEWRERLEKRGTFLVSIGTGVRSILRTGLELSLLRHFEEIALNADKVHRDVSDLSEFAKNPK